MQSVSAIAGLFFLAACTLNGQQRHSGQQALPIQNTVSPQARELDPATANSMYERFPDAKVKKNVSFSVVFDRAELINILRGSEGATVKFFVGAYDDNEDNGKKLQPTILLQTGGSSEGGGNARSLFAYRYFESNRLCPPPSPCRLEQ